MNQHRERESGCLGDLKDTQRTWLVTWQNCVTGSDDDDGAGDGAGDEAGVGDGARNFNIHAFKNMLFICRVSVTSEHRTSCHRINT